MESQFTDLLQKLVTERGKEALLSIGKCKALLTDYTKGQYNKEIRWVLQALESSVAKNITETSNVATCKRLMAKKLQDEYGLDQNIATDTVGLLAQIIRSEAESQDVSPIILQTNGTGNDQMAQSSLEVHLKKGNDHYQEKEYDQAITEFTEAIRLDPKNIAAYKFRGDVYKHQWDYDLAIADYNKAILLDPNNASAYSNRAFSYMGKENYGKAIADFKMARKLEPNNDDHYYDINRAKREAAASRANRRRRTKVIPHVVVVEDSNVFENPIVYIVVLLCTIGGPMLLDRITPDVSLTKPLGDSLNPACLYVQKNLILVSFDGQKVNRMAGFMAKTAAVNIPEGQHALVFNYYGDGFPSIKGFEITTTFESGGYYFVNYKKSKGDRKSRIRLYLRLTQEGIYLGPEK